MAPRRRWALARLALATALTSASAQSCIGGPTCGGRSRPLRDRGATMPDDDYLGYIVFLGLFIGCIMILISVVRRRSRHPCQWPCGWPKLQRVHFTTPEVFVAVLNPGPVVPEVVVDAPGQLCLGKPDTAPPVRTAWVLSFAKPAPRQGRIGPAAPRVVVSPPRPPSPFPLEMPPRWQTLEAGREERTQRREYTGPFA